MEFCSGCELEFERLDELGLCEGRARKNALLNEQGQSFKTLHPTLPDIKVPALSREEILKRLMKNPFMN